MFQKIKESLIKGSKENDSSSTATKMKSKEGEEGEHTSLLASSSAPQAASTTTTTEQLLQSAAPRTMDLSNNRVIKGSISIEEMERGAKRLNSDNIDSDSVNSLLVLDNDEYYYGEDNESLSSSLHGSSGAADAVGGASATLTRDDLEYLASQKQVSNSVFKHHEEEQATQQSQQQQQQKLPSSTLRLRKKGSSRRKIVDDIGNQLLEADGNARLEQEILFQSLNLGTTAATSNLLQELDAEDDINDGDDIEGNTIQAADKRNVLLLEKRISESTRRLRAASIDGGRMNTTYPPEIDHVKQIEQYDDDEDKRKKIMLRQVLTMIGITAFLILLVCMTLTLGTIAVGPPRQPVGPYKIIEAQVGHNFWQYYDFYSGKDSAGSNGYIMYVSEEKAKEEGIVNVVTETVDVTDMIQVYDVDDPRAMDNEDWLAEDLAFLNELKRKKLDEEMEKEQEEAEKAKLKKKKQKKKTTTTIKKKTDNSDSSTGTAEKETEDNVKKEKKASRLLQEQEELLDESETLKESSANEGNTTSTTHDAPKMEPFNPDPTSDVPKETFVVISSSPTPEGPRNSIRLEGRRRFNRGLFIIDLRHMPAGCGTWPAFWLTDEANWPVNGEIDIVEGVNYQDTAKTALHTTRECRMDDVPEGSKTGTWDTSVGIPNKKTGIPDMTFRYAQDCFVYDPHQWLNQGCVATDLKLEGRSLGAPLNRNGGGVYALEWDPVYKHIKTWVFSPHGRVPRNLRDALRTATNEDESTRVAPDTNQWGLPYGHFPIGDGTNCPSGHFRNMRLVINLAFCGSVAGNRYFMDCPKQFKQFKTCEKWVESNPDELKEAYWKIRGVYVYEREWQKQWS